MRIFLTMGLTLLICGPCMAADLYSMSFEELHAMQSTCRRERLTTCVTHPLGGRTTCGPGKYPAEIIDDCLAIDLAEKPAAEAQRQKELERMRASDANATVAVVKNAVEKNNARQKLDVMLGKSGTERDPR